MEDKALYHLSQVKKATEIFIVGSKRDTGTLDKLGLTAIEWLSEYTDEYTRVLKNKDVILILPSKASMIELAKCLQNMAKSLKLIELPGKPCSITAYVSTFDGIIEASENLSILIDKTKPYKPPKTSIPEETAVPSVDETIYPKTAEEASRNFEEYMRLVNPRWSESQIITAIDEHRTKNLGLPPLAEANLMEEIRTWIALQEGEFQTRDIFDELNIPKAKKSNISKILSRLISEKLVERTGRRTGCFRRIEKELVGMDIFGTEIKTVNITLPFGINDMVKIMPGNVTTLAGEKGAGKTGFLLNVAADNLGKLAIHYFNSEMGAGEMRARLELFQDVPLKDWGYVNFYERDENFQDVVVPGEGNLNIIDYLEIYEDFWLVKKRIAEIWRKLEGAIAIIALQKPRGRDTAFGGEGTIEKARLALALEKGLLKIVSAKNWKGKENPNGKVIKFKLVSGCNFIPQDEWSIPE